MNYKKIGQELWEMLFCMHTSISISYYKFTLYKIPIDSLLRINIAIYMLCLQ